MKGNNQDEIIKYRSIDNIEDNINIVNFGDEINDNNIANINGNNIPKEIIKYKTIDSNIPSDIINSINNDMNNKKIDYSIDEVLIDDNKNGNEISEEKNKKRQVLRGKNKRKNNKINNKNINNIDYENDNNNNIMSDNSDSITVVDNLLNNNKYNDNKIDINNGKNNSFKRNNIQKNENFNKKDVSSDIEPVIQDNMNNIMNIVNDINSNININELNQQAKRQYIVKYNIIQNLNGQSQNNPMSERSSMDGSVDEIITKKLIEIHDKNKKYEERINKAYNQVKTSKEFNEHKKFFDSLLKEVKPISSNLIYSVDKKIKNNKIDLEFFYKSNNIKWLKNLLNTVNKYIQQGYVNNPILIFEYNLNIAIIYIFIFSPFFCYFFTVKIYLYNFFQIIIGLFFIYMLLNIFLIFN